MNMTRRPGLDILVVVPIGAETSIPLRPCQSQHRSDNGELVDNGEGGGEQVGHADGSMSAGPRQGSRCAECGLPMLVIGRQILVGGAAVPQSCS